MRPEEYENPLWELRAAINLVLPREEVRARKVSIKRLPFHECDWPNDFTEQQMLMLLVEADARALVLWMIAAVYWKRRAHRCRCATERLYAWDELSPETVRVLRRTRMNPDRFFVEDPARERKRNLLYEFVHNAARIGKLTIHQGMEIANTWGGSQRHFLELVDREEFATFVNTKKSVLGLGELPATLAILLGETRASDTTLTEAVEKKKKRPKVEQMKPNAKRNAELGLARKTALTSSIQLLMSKTPRARGVGNGATRWTDKLLLDALKRAHDAGELKEHYPPHDRRIYVLNDKDALTIIRSILAKSASSARP